MCSGADLIRRKHGAEAHALTFPLLTTSEGEKFGKTAKGAVWLDSSLTSVWDFFQFWLNTSDQDVIRFLKLFTFVSRPEIESLAQATQEVPHARLAQKRLALEVTALVHGAASAADCESTASVLFGGADPTSLGEPALRALSQALVVHEVASSSQETLAQVLVQLGLEASMTRANEAIKTGAVLLNGQKVTEPKFVVSSVTPLSGGFSLIRKGKKSFAMIRHEEANVE
jgi:tyrosyl-tRNA synthetase